MDSEPQPAIPKCLDDPKEHGTKRDDLAEVTPEAQNAREEQTTVKDGLPGAPSTSVASESGAQNQQPQNADKTGAEPSTKASSRKKSNKPVNKAKEEWKKMTKEEQAQLRAGREEHPKLSKSEERKERQRIKDAVRVDRGDTPKGYRSRLLRKVLLGAQLVEELANRCFQMSEDGAEQFVDWNSESGLRNLILGEITTLPQGKRVLLLVGSHDTKGKGGYGYVHILNSHRGDFLAVAGVDEHEVLEFCLPCFRQRPSHVKVYKESRYTYDGWYYPLLYSGKEGLHPKGYLFLAVGDNGTVITMFPVRALPSGKNADYDIMELRPEHFCRDTPDRTIDLGSQSYDLQKLTADEQNLATEKEVRLRTERIRKRILQEEEEARREREKAEQLEKDGTILDPQAAIFEAIDEAVSSAAQEEESKRLERARKGTVTNLEAARTKQQDVIATEVYKIWSPPFEAAGNALYKRRLNDQWLLDKEFWLFQPDGSLEVVEAKGFGLEDDSERSRDI
ncbi:hypothetical protein BJ508DRAFT_335803 [Ascobolus immersus RN42]|uniref:Uncharacterized protein n=1 Tax=Ascobolus immersus RN42 TaxID=1160509 RepID=A0A3N4HB03_ASCIM|nr:hypothetical protein BJ508DRAFT_335803 [Ascobolus immersus RN42]